MFFKNEALIHVRLHPINTIKPRKKQSTTPLTSKILPTVPIKKDSSWEMYMMCLWEIVTHLPSSSSDLMEKLGCLCLAADRLESREVTDVFLVSLITPFTQTLLSSPVLIWTAPPLGNIITTPSRQCFISRVKEKYRRKQRFTQTLTEVTNGNHVSLCVVCLSWVASGSV